jgi:tRNA-specific 2-thiouridylase
VNNKSHIIVGLSGGVDSAVAALLLLEQGHEVEGLFMKNWEDDDDADYCAAEEDYRMAREVCAQLEIPLHAVNFARAYWDRVFSYFLAEYRAGRTPNPDVLCNKEIKFKAFLDHALALGADAIATGHYARIAFDGNRYRLLKGVDANKDQSYFLHALGQRELSRTRFPVGELTKPTVRALARAAGLPNHARKDSTGICFIGERKFKDFLSRYLPAQPGEIRTLEGEVKGRHDGLMFYTIGQRQGLGIGGPGDPWYVVGKDLAHNVLLVAQGEDHPALFADALYADQITWVAGAPPTLPLQASAKTRYRQADQPCRLTATNGSLLVEFEQPQRAIAPGQSVVFYRDDECLGGGVIERAQPTFAAQAPLVSGHESKMLLE